jgi:hypothetical protein
VEFHSRNYSTDYTRWQFTLIITGVCLDLSRPPLWCIGFSSSVHWLSYTEYIMCKLSFIHLVNDNSSILSLLILFSHIFSATMYVNSQLDIFCAVSTHLHGIRADKLLGKRHTKLFFQVPKIEDNEKMDFSKEFILTISLHGRRR